MVDEKHSGPLTESEVLHLQTGMVKAIGSLEKTVEQNITDERLSFPKSIIKSGVYGSGSQNSFSEPYISFKSDNHFIENEAWELRSNVKEKSFVDEAPLFKFVFTDWIDIERKNIEELKKLRNYGDGMQSFFTINKVAKARSDLFYLVVNVRIVDLRQSVSIFVCKREEWEAFLNENFNRPNDCLHKWSQKSGCILDAFKKCLKVKAKFWTMPTMGLLRNPFVLNNIFTKEDSYLVNVCEGRLEVFINEAEVYLPWFLKPIYKAIVRLTAGVTCNKQCFDLAYFLEAGEGENHKALFKYPERLLGVVRGEKIEWNGARAA